MIFAALAQTEMLAVLLAIAGATAAVAAKLRDLTSYDFQAYLVEFEKNYGERELTMRQSIFEANLQKIIAHNKEHEAGEHTWYAYVNNLTDWSAEEFENLRSSRYTPSSYPTVDLTFLLPSAEDVDLYGDEPGEEPEANPDSVDWRTNKVVTEVKNQQTCDSCWAFSATESIETAYAIASGRLVTLPPQTANCVKDISMKAAFDLVTRVGITSDSEVNDTGKDDFCSEFTGLVKADGYVKNPVNDAAALEIAVATKGPQSVVVAAGSWQFYGGGIFSGCSRGLFSSPELDLDHGVQLVGYSQEYWLVRNSWGISWGEKGYIRVSRAEDASANKDQCRSEGLDCKSDPDNQTLGGECGILLDTSYPTGTKAKRLPLLCAE
jgi:cathepsin L